MKKSHLLKVASRTSEYLRKQNDFTQKPYCFKLTTVLETIFVRSIMKTEKSLVDGAISLFKCSEIFKYIISL